MNAHFVCVKVDREERPDLDDIYMAATMAHEPGPGRLADDRVPHARAAAVLRRHLLPARRPLRAPRASPSLLKRIAERWEAERDRIRAPGPATSSSYLRLGATRRRPAARWATADLRPRGGAAPGRLRRALRRLRPRAQVPALGRAAAAAARAPAHRRRARARDGHEDARRDGARRHVRPARRRLPSLLRRRALAGAALREDAVRQRAARAHATWRRTRRRASRSTRGSRARSSTTCCAR